jgi:WD40 repeat protein/DNA-binding SARP family transcriptional activator
MLQIRLLGQFDLRLNGKRVTISSRAGQSLLAYLALTAGTPHRREKLAGLLWPDMSDETARKNLRQELWRIRKTLAGQNQITDYLLADEYTIAFNRSADYWLDATQMERPDLDIQSLSSNLSLYQGELLPGFFEDWILLERERIQTIFETKMDQLLGQLLDAERWIAVQEQAERWLALGNTPEPAYRALMLAHGARGDIAKVSAVYQRCLTDLDEKLGLEPSAETRALYDGLLKGTHSPTHAGRLQQSGTITFLFTDIEESTNLLDKLGDQYATVLTEHHKIMRNAIQKWNGHEVDTQGDAFFVTFTRALDAIQCAADAQTNLERHHWPQGKPVRVRMGLHTGEPLIASTGYVGMDVHRAARIGDAAHGGQVLLSHTTRELVLHHTPKGLSIRDLGEYRLKDMKFPTPIYQLVMEGLSFEFPPLRTKFSGTEAPTPGEPPFKGLQYFDELDSDLFYGREVLTAKLVKRLQESHFLSVIIGASGSGKSSVVRAGVVPALKKGMTLIDGSTPPEDSPNWRVHILTPTAHPLEGLATELTRDSESVTATATLMDDLMQDPRSLGLFLGRQKPQRHTLLVLDQFEELFTLCRDEFEREAFIDNLLTTIHQDDARVTLIITLRADFYAHLAQYPELRDAVAHQQEYIGPMTTEELRRAIEEPAKRAHWAFEPGLVDLILRDVGDEPGALPLLSHALLETWKRRAGHTLTLKGYADAGGVRGAISHTAESVYQHLSMAEQTIARNIFLRLTELGEGTEDTRRRATFDELMSNKENAEETSRVLNQLAEARLITLSENTAEVAHEALIREWHTLREWLNQDREGLRLHRNITEGAQEWELLEHDPGMLYRGARLSQAREWAALHPGVLNAGEKAFLDASDTLEKQEQTEREAQQQRELEAARKLAETERARAEDQTQSANRLRTRNRVITSVGSIAIILALVAGTFGLQSNQNAAFAQNNAATAQVAKAVALNAQSTAVAESQIRATQQAVAEANFQQAEAQRLAAEANKLSLSQGSSELIALLAVRSMNTQYTPQGDGTLVAASKLNYPRQLFVGHSADLTHVAYSPDGKYVLSGSNDKTARLWDARAGKEIQQFVHMDGVDTVAFSPDGSYILTSTWDKTTRLWDAKSGKEIRQFEGGGAAYSPDGKTIVTSSDNSVSLWDATTGQKRKEFTISDGTLIYYPVLSPDGKYLLAGDSAGIAHLWDIQTDQEVQKFTGHTSTVFWVAFSPDGKLVLTGSWDGTARLWDMSTGKELQRFIGHTGIIYCVAFSPDGRYIFTSSIDRTARLWNAQTGQELGRFTSAVPIYSVAISPDGNLLLTGGDDGLPRLWDIKPKLELPSFIYGDAISALAFSPDGKYMLTAGNRDIVLWDTHTGQKLHEFIGHTDLINYGVAYSPDGKYILSGSWDKSIRLWDIQTGKEIYKLVDAGGVNSVAFSPDGKYIATASIGAARLWKSETGEKVSDFSGVDQRTWRVTISPNGEYVAFSSDDGTRLFEVFSGRLIRQFIGQTDAYSVAFSPDGKYLVTGGGDQKVWLWDVNTGQNLWQFIGHTDTIWTVAFSPDGKYVVTASADGTARLWDAQTGQELRRFIGHTAGVENVVFSPDGKFILTGSDDGTAMLWDVDYHTTIQYLCSILLRDFTDDERAQYGITVDAPTCPKP